VSTYDDGTDVEFDEPETLEAPGRQRRRMRPPRPGGPRRSAPPPPGAVALARLAGFVALAIVVVVGVVFWVGPGKSTHDEYASYMNDLRPIALNSAKTGTEFVNALSSANLTLTGLRAKLQLWSQQQQQYYDDALRLRPPGPLQSAHQQALATFQLRAIGLIGLANAIAEAGSKSDTAVANSLAGQAQILSASDVVWANLFHLPVTETLKTLGVRGVAAPPSQIVSNPEVITASSFGIVYQRLKAANTGGKPPSGLHGSTLGSTQAVSGSSVKTLTTSTPTTVDVSPNLVFKVTFTNSGNFQEVKVPVTLTISVFGRSVLTKKVTVQSILAQQTKTVPFGNLQLPTSAFGANARVHVEIGKVPGETQLGDNASSYPVFFSLPSGG
jgi:hypothetical protein